jgi:deoxyribodipyrimidine photo-lyase
VAVVFWFRNDLRDFDNNALDVALNLGATQALYVKPLKQWEIHHKAPIQVDFIKRHIISLSHSLARKGITLTVLEAGDYADQARTVLDFCQQNNVTQLVAGLEDELNERQRDKVISERVALSLIENDVIVERGKIVKANGDYYQVFTAFKKAWLSYVRSHYSAEQPCQFNNSYLESDPSGLSAKWPLASAYLTKSFPQFLAHKITLYKSQRDLPSIKGTSGASGYLAIGALSPKTLLNRLLALYPDAFDATNEGVSTWLSEIIWREFYKHLLFFKPNLIKGYAFKSQYQKLPWHNDETRFIKWCEGKTGYPIVDAAMRQLNTTGWMHNRLRMIVASFLTKHLLIDWRKGEDYFMSKLIDGDFAANNGGWQWSASTGCDAQPYFRIFNPISQSEKFDPNGDFIRKYLPELDFVPAKEIHFPHAYLKQVGKTQCYWSPVVEHKEARLQALAFYKV